MCGAPSSFPPVTAHHLLESTIHCLCPSLLGRLSLSLSIYILKKTMTTTNILFWLGVLILLTVSFSLLFVSLRNSLAILEEMYIIAHHTYWFIALPSCFFCFLHDGLGLARLLRRNETKSLPQARYYATSDGNKVLHLSRRRCSELC